MIELKRIKKDNDFIVCDAFIEDCETPIKLSFNMKSGKLGMFILPKNYEWCTTHISKARDFLFSLIDVVNVPKEKTIMWY